MADPSTHHCPRLKLRNLDLAQKLLVLTILATVGFGYLGALANLFATSAPADGKQTLELSDIPAIWRTRGLGGVLDEVGNSLGMEDVILRYHGSGPGITKMETALKGVMRPILEDEFGEEDAQRLIREVTEWSLLEAPLRKAAYEEGVPLNPEDGSLQFDKLRQVYTEDGERKDPDAELELLAIQDTFTDNCTYCHGQDSSDPRARKIPLETYDQIEVYCKEDRGIPVNQLALTTHVHLLGFSVLFAMTGFLFSLTEWPSFIRIIFVPWTLFFQIVEIACWWMAKTDVIYAKGVFWLGAVVGIGLGIQILGTTIDLLIRRPNRNTEAVSE